MSTLKKSTTSEKDKAKWAKVMTSDMMSSEESDSHDEDLIIVKPLQWRHDRVGLFFHRLDQAGGESKTTQAKWQRKRRTHASVPSQRPKPTTCPSWAFAENDKK